LKLATPLGALDIRFTATISTPPDCTIGDPAELVFGHVHRGSVARNVPYNRGGTPVLRRDRQLFSNAFRAIELRGAGGPRVERLVSIAARTWRTFGGTAGHPAPACERRRKFFWRLTLMVPIRRASKSSR